MTAKKRCVWANRSEELKRYHDEEYGFPVTEDRAYFERLTLELFQAGLSWQTILKKRKAFREAFDGFDFRKIASYGEKEKKRLMDNAGIVRNRRKIEATIFNAGSFAAIVDRCGSFERFLEKLPLHDKERTIQSFKEHFKFMGPLIVEEFLMSVGLWNVKHERGCFLHPGRRRDKSRSVALDRRGPKG